MLSPAGRSSPPARATGSVRLWSFPSGAPRATVLEGGGAVGALAFSPDSRVLAASDEAGTIHLWSLPEGSPLGRLTGHAQWVTALAFSPDGRTLASCSGDRTVRLWTVATRTARATLRGHTSTVFALAFTPDGATVLSGSADRTIRLWTVATARAAGSLSGPTREIFTLAVTPDGRTVLSGSSDGLRFWSLADRRLLGTTEANVESLALSADGIRRGRWALLRRGPAVLGAGRPGARADADAGRVGEGRALARRAVAGCDRLEAPGGRGHGRDRGPRGR